MKGIIPDDIITIDADQIDFGDKEAVKGLILKLLSTVEQLIQTNRELRAER